MKRRFCGIKLPLVIAHRGYSARFPENTLPAFAAAMAAGADMIELDVTMSADGHPVVIHDETLERTTSGTGPVADRTLVELKSLDAGLWKGEEFGGTTIPTLGEVFDAVGGRVPVNVEIKPDGAVRRDALIAAVLAYIHEKKLHSTVVISSGDYQVLRSIRTLDGEVMLSVLSDGPEGAVDVAALATAVGAVSYNPGQSFVTAGLVRTLHRAGVLVFPWSLNSDNTAGTMKRMLALGVDGFFANDPVLFRTLAHPAGR